MKKVDQDVKEKGREISEIETRFYLSRDLTTATELASRVPPKLNGVEFAVVGLNRNPSQLALLPLSFTYPDRK